jgi:hypothetical protein
LTYLVHRFRTIIICRFLLTLRAIYQGGDEEDNEKSQIGTLRFASRVVGSLGAPVETNPTRFADGSEDDDYDEEIMYSRDPLAAGLVSEGSSKAEDNCQEKSRHSSQGTRISRDTEAAAGSNVA